MKNKPARYVFLFFILLCSHFALYGQGYDIDYMQAGPGLYIYTSYYDMGEYKKVGANGLVIAGNEEVIIVDAPWDSAQTAQLMEWVADSLRKPVAAFIITHAHDDRIGGIAQVHARGIATIGTSLTADEASTNGFEAPRFTFSADTLIEVAGAQAEVYYPGPGHTIDNCVVYVPASRLLYGGCFLKSAGSKNLGNIADVKLGSWPKSLLNLQERFSDAEFIIPGHGFWLPGAVENTHRLLKEHQADTIPEGN
ncbi:MAG: subclass B1 metallo-beta-lactamase [Cyclobacteriaceae bacterium]